MAGKPGYSSKFQPILDIQEPLTDFHGNEAKNTICLKKLIQNGRLVALIDAKGIDVAQPIWPWP